MANLTSNAGAAETSQERRAVAQHHIDQLRNAWFCDGALQQSKGTQIDVIDPSRGVAIGQTPECSREEVRSAVDSAARAFGAWQERDGRDRARCLRNAADIIRGHLDELSYILSVETGKAIRTECRGEAALLADIFDYFAGYGSEAKGKSVPFAPGVMAVTTREPIGIVAGIVPWNMPLMFLGYKLAAPVLLGNCCVIKAPELAPFTILRVAELIADC